MMAMGTFERRRRGMNTFALVLIRALTWLMLVILLLIIGYIVVRGVYAENQYISEVIPLETSGTQGFQVVVNTGNRMDSLAYPVLRDLVGGKVFSLRKISSVDADVHLYIEGSVWPSAMEYLGLNANQIAKSQPETGTAGGILQKVSQTKGGIALLPLEVSLDGQKGIKRVVVEDMVLAVHPSVVELIGNIRLSSVSQTQLQPLLAGQIANWSELGGQDLPVVVSPVSQVSSQPGSLALMTYRDAASQDMETLKIVATRRSANLRLGYIFEKPVESGRYGGISTIIGNTLLMVLITIAFASPLGIGAAVFLVEYPTGKRLVSIIRSGVDVLAGIPSIIFGLFGLLVFVQLFGWGFSLLSGSLTIAIMVLPTIIRTSEEAIRMVDRNIVEASIALGATKAETIWKVIIPAASPGIITGIILAIGRAMGETAALIYTVGSSTDFALGPLDSARVLAMHIYLTITEGQSLDRAFASALVLLVMVLAINIIARSSARRLLNHGK